MYSDDFCRYSNTLLVSLNNRISIREEAATKGVSVRSPPTDLQFVPRSGGSIETMIMQPLAAHEGTSLADKENERVVIIE